MSNRFVSTCGTSGTRFSLKTLVSWLSYSTRWTLWAMDSHRTWKENSCAVTCSCIPRRSGCLSNKKYLGQLNSVAFQKEMHILLFFPGLELKFTFLFFSDWKGLVYIGLLYSVWKKYLDPCFQTEESAESPKLLIWGRCETVLVQTHLHLP